MSMRYFPLRILRIEKQQASFVFPFQSLLAAHKVKCQPPESWVTKRAAHVGIDVQAGGGGQRCHGMPAGLTFSGMPWERQQSSWFTQSKGKRWWWIGEGLQGREGTRVTHLHAGLLSFPVTRPPAPCFCCCSFLLSRFPPLSLQLGVFTFVIKSNIYLAYFSPLKYSNFLVQEAIY